MSSNSDNTLGAGRNSDKACREVGTLESLVSRTVEKANIVARVIADIEELIYCPQPTEDAKDCCKPLKLTVSQELEPAHDSLAHSIERLEVIRGSLKTVLGGLKLE